MQISSVEVIPVQLTLREPFRTAAYPEPITQVESVFLRAELVRDYGDTWGCAVLDPTDSVSLERVKKVCQNCADRLQDINPLNTQYALAELSEVIEGLSSVQCAIDMLLFDLLGLWSKLPLFRLLGGYRDRIQTSITLPLEDVPATVEMAEKRARDGFGIFKLKGGLDPEALRRRPVDRAVNAPDVVANAILRRHAALVKHDRVTPRVGLLGAALHLQPVAH